MLRRRLATAALALALATGGVVGLSTGAEAAGKCMSVSFTKTTSSQATVKNNCGNLAAYVLVDYNNGAQRWWFWLNPLQSTKLTAAHPVQHPSWGLAPQP